jgi:protein-arginine kinase
MDYTKLNAPPLPEDEAKMIKSTRVRVGRNLADFPLGPGLSKEQRKEIETTVTKALTTFDGELAGKYYALTSLTEHERKQLIEDHFLFKEGDRFLEACGLNREWPDARGIFHNNEKTFLVWVNEEDQLRIISMQDGADLGAVFTRLSKACSHIEKVAKFAHDDHLGYITSCPTNLGTALRASVHIHLPNLGLLKEEFQAIADTYHVQIRGIHGEHSETNDFVYDISNKRRLGRSEVDLVQDMYNGVKAMIKREKELLPKDAHHEEHKEEVHDLKVSAALKSPTELIAFPIFPDGTKSLLSKYLSREIWNELKDVNDKFGFSFKQAIFSGCQNTDSGIGVYAGSHDSYHTFAPLFDKIVEDYHGHKHDAKHVSDMDYTKL